MQNVVFGIIYVTNRRPTKSTYTKVILLKLIKNNYFQSSRKSRTITLYSQTVVLGKTSFLDISKKIAKNVLGPHVLRLYTELVQHYLNDENS